MCKDYSVNIIISNSLDYDTPSFASFTLFGTNYAHLNQILYAVENGDGVADCSPKDTTERRLVKV